MEDLRLSKSVMAFLQAIALSIITAAICSLGVALGDFQTVLFSVTLEMCGLFIIGVFVDNFGEDA